MVALRRLLAAGRATDVRHLLALRVLVLVQLALVASGAAPGVAPGAGVLAPGGVLPPVPLVPPPPRALEPAAMGGAVLFGHVERARAPESLAAGWPLLGPIGADGLAALGNATSPQLLGALQDYFALSVMPGMVYLSACEEDAVSLLSCISATRAPRDAELFLVPYLATMNASAGYVAVAAALDQLAEAADGLAVLDLPADIASAVALLGACRLGCGDWPTVLAGLVNVTASVQRITMPLQRQRLVLYSSPLLGPAPAPAPVGAGATRVSAAASMAGVISGALPWLDPAGAEYPLAPLRAAASLDASQMGQLADLGINSFLQGPQGNATALPWGAITLAPTIGIPPLRLAISRTLSLIRRTIASGLQAFAFSPNTLPTWGAVRAAAQDFLTGLWSNGALSGDQAEAFQVSIGLGTTMTAEDILNGYMILQVQLVLPGSAQPSVVAVASSPATYIEVFTQQLMSDSRQF
jgi:hypothetical protein